MKKAVNIRLEENLLQNLDKYANELEKTRANLIENALEFYFDKLDEIVADRRIDNLKDGKSSVTSLKDVFAKAGIDV